MHTYDAFISRLYRRLFTAHYFRSFSFRLQELLLDYFIISNIGRTAY